MSLLLRKDLTGPLRYDQPGNSAQNNSIRELTFFVAIGDPTHGFANSDDIDGAESKVIFFKYEIHNCL